MTQRNPSVAAFRCAGCGHASPRWFGRCPDCGAWSSASQQQPADSASAQILSLAVPGEDQARLPTDIAEVDRVLGGGLVAGAVLLLAGEPGIGKSTLVLQLIDSLLAGGRATLLVTGEESVSQVALRARRLGAALDSFRVAATASLDEVLAAAALEQPEVLVIDSVQTLEGSALEQPAGSVVQVRECAAALARHAKATGMIVILVGHVTKEGTVAGPKTLEHMVDAVLTLEGERTGALRLLRAGKNRYGSCEETGVFTMTDHGLRAVGDPSAMLLADRRTGEAGSIVFPGLEGTRPVLTEIQALVDDSSLPQPRRVAIGLDARRLSLLLAVLHARASIELAKQDVFAAAAGGLAVREPAADLAIALALASAHVGVTIPPCVVAVGEVGLAGEVRRVPGLPRRLAEAARLGFTVALCPRGVERAPAGLEVVVVDGVRDAIDAAAMVGPTGASAQVPRGAMVQVGTL